LKGDNGAADGGEHVADAAIRAFMEAGQSRLSMASLLRVSAQSISWRKQKRRWARSIVSSVA
jgi:hypothetical protein